MACFSDPVQAYDRIAAEFPALSERRRPYLAEIERQIIQRAPPGSTSLLDIGAGDGSRAKRIADAVKLRDVVLLEPSSEMRKLWPSDVRGWALAAEQLSEKNGNFDLVTCLWNVLGHVFQERSRVEVLRQCGRLLAPGGRLFIDVNHRYNFAAYGTLRTLGRMLFDLAHPSEKNGDVKLNWEIAGRRCTTYGHVFTHSEFRRLAGNAGLVIEHAVTIDYATGRVRNWRFSGNPLFVLRRP